MLTDIEFSPHSLLKMEILKAHGMALTREIVEDVIRKPDRIDVGYEERLIAQKGFDATHAQGHPATSSGQTFISQQIISK